MTDRLRRWWRQATQVEARASDLDKITARLDRGRVYLDFANDEGHHASMDMPAETAVRLADAIYQVAGRTPRT